MLWMTALLVLLTAPRSYEVSLQTCWDADTCTFTLHLGLDVTVQNQQVRFCDVNASEMTGESRMAAISARNILVGWLTSAKSLRIDVPQKTTCKPGSCDQRDKYGRLLATIYADGENVNARMLREGVAMAYHLKCE